MIPFYIGTYTSGTSQGIYRCLLDSSNGNLSGLKLVAQIDNPTFLAIHPSLPVLYTCSETRRDGRREGAQVVAYRIGADGVLTRLGSQPSGGIGPCYVSTDQSGRVALVANYASGCISSMPIAADGSLGNIATHVQHSGKSLNPARQEGPHAHCIMTDPGNRYVCAVDLGLDQVLVYKLDVGTAKLSLKPSGNFHARPGSGPRHIAFSRDGQYAYIVHELGNTLTAAHWNAIDGRFTELATANTLPPSYAGESSTAEVLVHPHGNFIYASNRGHDSITQFTFNDKSRTLTPITYTSTAGKTPRNFRIDPTGKYLLAENQESDSIVVFRIDDASGQLTQVGEPLHVGAPCCIKFDTRKK